MDKSQLAVLVERGYSTRHIAKEVGLSQTTIRYWLVKFDLQTGVIHKCHKCGITNPLSFTKGRYSTCRRCRTTSQKGRYHQYKTKAVQYKGGGCELCGYNKCLASLDFHHKNETNKEFGIGGLRREVGFKKLKEEIEKCEVICANCHRIVHHEQRKKSGNGA